MIVAMIDANHISERLASLKLEISDLRVANAHYWNRKEHTALDISKCSPTATSDTDQIGIGGYDETLRANPLQAQLIRPDTASRTHPRSS